MRRLILVLCILGIAATGGGLGYLLGAAINQSIDDTYMPMTSGTFTPVPWADEYFMYTQGDTIFVCPLIHETDSGFGDELMADIGRKSKIEIDSLVPALKEAITAAMIAAPPELDFAVISGRRTDLEQFELWKQGRALVDGIWTELDKSKLVTQCDGINDRSKHQDGEALDIARYVDGGVKWDEESLAPVTAYLVGFCAARGIELTGGFRWGWDWGHLEVVK